MEVNLIGGKVDITPIEDGQIDPAQLLKATYDSGVTAAEMDMTARGRIVKKADGSLSLQVSASRSFAIAPNELSKSLEPLAGSPAFVTVRGQLYKKPAGKQKALAAVLPLLILEVQKKE